MGFNRGEIRVKATNISVMNGKGGKSIMGCRVMRGTITATVSAHSHLDGRVRDAPRDSSHPTMPGNGGHTRRSTRHGLKNKGMYSQVHIVKIGFEKKGIKKENKSDRKRYCVKC